MMNPRYGVVLKDVESKVDTPVEDNYFLQSDGQSYDDELVKMATNLQYVLVTLCSGGPSTFLRRGGTSNGFESWRRIHKRYELPSRQKAVGRLSTILKPTFNQQSFEDSLAV